MRLNVECAKAYAGDRFLVHLRRPNEDTALCGRRTRVAAKQGEGFRCRVCHSRAASIHGVIYVIHFDEPYVHARHYTGWTRDLVRLSKRLRYHRSGRGAKLLKAVNEAGISWNVVTVFYGDRNEERRMKNRGGAARHCSLCRDTQCAGG